MPPLSSESSGTVTEKQWRGDTASGGVAPPHSLSRSQRESRRARDDAPDDSHLSLDEWNARQLSEVEAAARRRGDGPEVIANLLATERLAQQRRAELVTRDG
jgi:predicted nucleic acid-binding protein